MAASNVRLFVKCDGTPDACRRIIAEPAEQDEQGRYILDRPGVWHLYAIHNNAKVRSYLIWEHGTWKVLGEHRALFQVVPKGEYLLVSSREHLLGCYRVLDIKDAWKDNQGRFVINAPGAWEISRIESYKMYTTRLCVWDDGSWTFIDDPEGFMIVRE